MSEVQRARIGIAAQNQELYSTFFHSFLQTGPSAEICLTNEHVEWECSDHSCSQNQNPCGWEKVNIKMFGLKSNRWEELLRKESWYG